MGDGETDANAGGHAGASGRAGDGGRGPDGPAEGAGATGGPGSAGERYRRGLPVSLAASVGTTALALVGILILAMGMSAWSPRFWFSTAAIGLAVTGVYAAGVDAPLRTLTRLSFWTRLVIGLVTVFAIETLVVLVRPMLNGASGGDPAVLAFVWVLTLVPFAAFILMVRVTEVRPLARRAGAWVWGVLLLGVGLLAFIV